MKRRLTVDIVHGHEEILQNIASVSIKLFMDYGKVVFVMKSARPRNNEMIYEIQRQELSKQKKNITS